MGDDITVVVTTADSLSTNITGDDDIVVQETEGSSVRDTYALEKFVGNGTQTVFDLSATARANTLIIFVSGMLQEVDVDYTLNVDANEITFTTAVKNGRKIEVRYVNN